MNEGISETTEREESVAETSPKRLALEWVWPKWRRERLQGAKLSIGQSEDASLPVNVKGVSRSHAGLNRQGPIYVIRDLYSTNGTWLNGRRIDHAPVAPGAVLRVGECVGVFVEGQEEAIEEHEQK